MNEKYIQTLRDLIKKNHGCPARYNQSTMVKEEANGTVLWEGSVETFDLGGHPTARQCYAWSQKDSDGRLQYATALKLPPIDSPKLAIQSHLTRQNPPT